MDESKSLINMAVSAMLSAMFIGVAIGSLSIGYMIWAYMSRQDAANLAMSVYANFTSYDNTTVRGQEVLQLIENDEDIFVLILQASAGTSMNDLSINTGKSAYTWYRGAAKDFELYKAYSQNHTLTMNPIPTCERALSCVYNWATPLSPSAYGGGVNDISELTNAELQKLFLDPNELGIGDHDFAAFKSVLIYADDSSCEIAGVVLVKQATETTSF